MSPRTMVKTAIASSIFLLTASIVSAQASPQQTPTAPAWSPSQNIGMFSLHKFLNFVLSI
jgi:hypothetical protein